tara:strand:+ start:4398 stop:4733 length:336 start_codon:yes stop_codon:yes gene_type:complete
VEGRLGGFRGSRGGEVGALTPALSQQTGRGWKSCGLEGELVGEVAGGFEGGEGLEVGLGFDDGLAGGVDGLDRFDGVAVVGGVDDGVELCEGEAVDLADEDGGHRGIEEVL